MNGKLSNFVALDLGSSKIASVAAYVNKKGEAKIVSQNLHYSKGIRSGTILDLKDAENSITGAIYSLEKDCGKNIKQVTISLTGSGTKSYYINNKIKLSNQAISKQDIKKLIQKTLFNFKIKNQEIIHYFPLEFTLDNDNSIEDPIGMFGEELECKLHIIAANSNILVNMTNCLAKCHVEISNIVLAIYAAAIACLSTDEKNLGSVIIDMGARITSFGIFLADKLIYTHYIDVGSFHVTSDIAKVFTVSFVTAEKLKILYGNAMPSSFDKNNVINMHDLDVDEPYNSIVSISSHDLAAVIHARMEEILLMVKSQYDKVVAKHMITRCLIITGGGSMIRGVKELASKIFDTQVRVGKPNIIADFAEDCNLSMYSTAIGMVHTQSLKQQKNSFDMEDHKDSNWLRKLFIWFKENI